MILSIRQEHVLGDYSGESSYRKLASASVGPSPQWNRGAGSLLRARDQVRKAGLPQLPARLGGDGRAGAAPRRYAGIYGLFRAGGAEDIVPIEAQQEIDPAVTKRALAIENSTECREESNPHFRWLE